MSRERTPIKDYPASTIAYNKGDTAVLQVLEYSCPVCGCNDIKAVVYRYIGIAEGTPFVNNKTIPKMTRQWGQPGKGTRVSGAMCQRCGMIFGGTTDLTQYGRVTRRL